MRWHAWLDAHPDKTLWDYFKTEEYKAEMHKLTSHIRNG